MYAQLGDIIFQSLIGFSSMSVSKSVNYAEQAKIKSKPRLQAVGQNLDEISLSFKFNAIFCNPSEQLSQLENYHANEEVIAFVAGNGDFYGNFVIPSFSYIINRTADDGTIIDVDVSVSLKEYFTDDLLEDTKLAKVQQAPGISRPASTPNRLQVELQRAQTEAAEKVAAKNLAETNAEVKNTGSLIAKANAGVKSAQKAIADAQKAIAKAVIKTQQFRAHVIAFQSAYANAAKIITDADLLISSFTTFKTALGTGNINTVFQENANLQFAMGRLTRSGASVVSISATRLPLITG